MQEIQYEAFRKRSLIKIIAVLKIYASE